jgi:hypothetical protein
MVFLLLEDVQKGHFAAVSRKIALDYKHAANDKSLEKKHSAIESNIHSLELPKYNCLSFSIK